MGEQDKQLTAYAGYDEFAQQYAAAYNAFSATYELRMPRPVAPRRHISNVGVLFALAIMLIAQVIVSGSRTIKEFGEVGVAAFIMLELGMVAFAFIRTSRNYTPDRKRFVMRWVEVGLVISFLVLLSGNIDATLKSKDIHLPDTVNLIIQLAIAVSAPVLAFITGDVLGMYGAMQAYERKEAMAKYDQAFKEWGVGLANSWKSQKAQWGVKIEVLREPVRIRPELPDHTSAVRPSDMDADGRGHGTGYGYSKRTDARTQVWTYLDGNPDSADMPVRELAEIIGVGKSTVAAVLRDWRTQ